MQGDFRLCKEPGGAANFLGKSATQWCVVYHGWYENKQWNVVYGVPHNEVSAEYPVHEHKLNSNTVICC